MTQKSRSWLSTGQAAALCSVTPDTVLKWIRKGRLDAVRTAGGHFRIRRKDLEPLVVRDEAEGAEFHGCPGGDRQPLRCWEYFSNGADVNEQCRSCVVYRVRASRCFQMEGEHGHSRRYCRTSCDNCVYYRRVQGMSTNVLVVSGDEVLLAHLEKEDGSEVTYRTARSGYEASRVIEEFTPAFALVDRDVETPEGRELLHALTSDPRAPGLKVILVAGDSADLARLEKGGYPEVASILRKPFGSREIASIVRRFSVEKVPLEREEPANDGEVNA